MLAVDPLQRDLPEQLIDHHVAPSRCIADGACQVFRQGGDDGFRPFAVVVGVHVLFDGSAG